MTTDQYRSAIIEEAKSWLGTPYHHAADIKGAGVDCAFFLIRVFHSVGLIPDIDPRPYPPDWHLHLSDPRYLEWMLKYSVYVENPMPGDLALFKFGRVPSHAAIVIEWPRVIHSYRDSGVIFSDADKEPLVGRLSGFFSVWDEYGRIVTKA